MVTINSDEYRSGGGVDTGAHNPHNPPSSWDWDTATARNGAFYSNLAAGVYGPGAIDAYMSEGDQSSGGATNHEVAHRRLLLYSRRAEFATGDVTLTPSGNSPYFAANALYSAGNLLAIPTPQFVSWPSDGFFPEPLITKYWSLSYPGADFSSATVSMTHATAGGISTSVVSSSASYGDKTLVWEPNLAQLSSATDDQTYQVVISNIVIEGVAQSHSYSVTVINPNRLTKSLVLSGSLTPPDTGARYFFDPVDQVSGYGFQVSSETSGLWQEGAENATSGMIIDGTASSYSLRSSVAKSSGNYGFHVGLTQANFKLQYVELDRLVVPAADSNLVFSYRKRRMGIDTRAKAEISTNDGISWAELWGIQGDNGYSNSFSSQQQVSLASYAGQAIRIRFAVERPLTSEEAYWAADGDYGDYNGIQIDDVDVTGSDMELVDIVETSYSVDRSQVFMDAASAGLVGSLLGTNVNYIIRLRARTGDHWFPYGPALSVTPVAESSLSDYEAWMRSEYYMIGDFAQDYDGDGIPNGMERVFGLNPTDRSDASAALKPQIVDQKLELSHSIISGASVAAELSYTLKADSWLEVAVDIENGVATVSVPLDAPAIYLRWKVNQ